MCGRLSMMEFRFFFDVINGDYYKPKQKFEIPTASVCNN